MRLVWIDAGLPPLLALVSPTSAPMSTPVTQQICFVESAWQPMRWSGGGGGISDRSIGSHPEGKVAGVDRIVIQEVQGGVTALKCGEFSSLEPEQASRALVGMILVGS